MYNYNVSLVAGFVAMAFAISSYMFKKKLTFLIAQLGAMVFLAVSYLFIEEFFAMASMSISVSRTITYMLLERKGKAPKVWLKSLFAFSTIVSYVIVNLIILQTAKPLDLLLMSANVMYSFFFGIRNVKLLQSLMLIPTGVTSIYNFLAPASLFVIISYVLEFFANVIGLIKIAINEKKQTVIEFKKKQSQNG